MSARKDPRRGCTPACPPVHPGDGYREGPHHRGRLESAGPRAARPRVHRGLPLAQSSRIRDGTGRGRPAPKRKWTRELDYRLIKELWTFGGNRIAVRFAYECHDDSGNWFRSYGNENWEFDDDGVMRTRIASINDQPIAESERKFHWPLGHADHPTLSDLGF